MRTFGEGAETLPRELRLKLTNKFLSFCEARASIRRRMESYVLDYQVHDAGAAHKYERLEEQYAADRPDLSRLSADEDGIVLWSMRDVAIVLGRNVSSVMRTLRRMENSPEWGERLNGLTHRSENPGRGAATLYAGGIFDAVVDFYEDAYVARVTHPRHGAPLPEERVLAVRAFWRWLRENPDGLDWQEYARSLSLAFGPSVSAATLYQCLRLIVRRAFSIKTGTFFLALFALIYELSGRWPWFNAAVPILSLSTLAFVLHQMPRGRWHTPWLVDAGACAMTFTLLWGLAVTAAPEGPSHRLLSTFVSNQDRRYEGESTDPVAPPPTVYVDLVSVQEDYTNPYNNAISPGNLYLSITPSVPAKEIFYKLSEDMPYRTTGFLPQRDPKTGLPYPDLSITAPLSPAVTVHSQFIGTDGRRYGPFVVLLDVVEARVRKVKTETLHGPRPWVAFERGEKETTLTTDLFMQPDNSVIEKVRFGIDTREPDREHKPLSQQELLEKERTLDKMAMALNADNENVFKDAEEMRKHVEDFLIQGDRRRMFSTSRGIRFVSMQIFFSDGTSSDVRI
ncbi:MAG: hypothetical protein Q4A13_10880, partial [Fretibacterium sp.]|nr:hypothetical protein [Fretibacterium sp.]